MDQAMEVSLATLTFNLQINGSREATYITSTFVPHFLILVITRVVPLSSDIFIRSLVFTACNTVTLFALLQPSGRCARIGRHCFLCVSSVPRVAAIDIYGRVVFGRHVAHVHAGIVDDRLSSFEVDIIRTMTATHPSLLLLVASW